MSSSKAGAEAQTESFPALSPVVSSKNDGQGTTITSPPPTAQQDAIPRRQSTRTRKTRASSLLQNLMESNPPLGAWQAIGEDTAKGPTIPEIKNGSYNTTGWSHEGQLESRQHNPHEIHARRLSRASSTSRRSRGRSAATTPAVLPEEMLSKEQETLVAERTLSQHPTGPDSTGTYPNGYRFPKKHTWKQSCAIYGAAFWKFFITLKGFLITIYALNVVAWGAMIFFLLIPGATPAMCKSYPDCENKQFSARQIWIENTSQILTALFCVTAFGLLPWRARDFYYMVLWQAKGDQHALRKLAGFYRGWYRLEGSDKLPEHLGPPPKPADLKINMFGNYKQQDLEDDEDIDLAAYEANPAIPLPPWSMPEAPLTGCRARPTKFKNLAWIIWMYMLNTLFQVGLCVVMWGFNRFQRNHAYFSALTALFIVLGCGTGAGAGIVAGREGGVIKRVEGIPVRDYDQVESEADFKQRMARQTKKDEKKAKKESKRQKNGEKGDVGS